jgi:hypothetical protein
VSLPAKTELVLPLTEPLWQQLIGKIALGTQPEEAIRELALSRTLVEGAVRTDPEMGSAWHQACLDGKKINWPPDLLHEVCEEIAAGKTIRWACEKHGRNHKEFLRLALRDPVIKEQYELARQVRAELLQDEIIEMADDDSHDIDLDGRGNGAAVRRSELKVKTRLEIAKAANPDKFREKGGTKVNVETNVQNNVQVNLNHSERLARAKTRIKATKVKSTPDNSGAVEAVLAPSAATDWE